MAALLRRVLNLRLCPKADLCNISEFSPVKALFLAGNEKNGWSPLVMSSTYLVARGIRGREGVQVLYDCCSALEARMDENDRDICGKLRPLQLAGELADETVNMTDIERGLYEFIGELTGDASELEEEIEGERVSIVDVIDGERGDGIPSLLADSTSDLRLEPLIEKLVAHTRSRTSEHTSTQAHTQPRT